MLHRLCLMLFIVSSPAWAQSHLYSLPLWGHVQKDYSSHYTWPATQETGVLLAMTGIFANTGLDGRIEHIWQKDIRSKPVWEIHNHQANRTFWDHLLQPANDVGGMDSLIPLYIASTLAGHYLHNNHLKTASLWGERSLRTFLLGGPQQFAWTHILGAHRPHEVEGSRWRFFRGKRGVSGHTFYGAIPFLNAAMMLDEHVALQSFFYVCSTLPGLARINEDKHYFSQVLSGWGLSYLAARTVARVSEKEEYSMVSWSILPMPGSAMITASIKF